MMYSPLAPFDTMREMSPRRQRAWERLAWESAAVDLPADAEWHQGLTTAWRDPLKGAKRVRSKDAPHQRKTKRRAARKARRLNR